MNYSHNFSWQGPAVISRIRKEIKTAVRKSAERVRNVTKKEYLNTSGKAMTTKAGLNKGTQQQIQARAKIIQDLKTRTVKKTGQVIQYGGNYTFKSKGQKTRIDRIYWYGEPLKRWVQSSVPGTPPHKQFGNLQRSIAWQLVSDGMRAKIGPSKMLKYGRIQELGGKTKLGPILPPRPYLRPAFDQTVPATLMEFRKAMARATTK